MSRNSILIGTGALLLMGMIAYAFSGRGAHSGPSGKGMQAKATPVKVAAAERGEVELTLDVIGRVEAFSTVTMRSRVNGQLQALAFVPGQRVERGKVIARIDPSLLEAQLQQAQGILAKDDASLVKARADVARYTEIAARGYVSKADLDTYQANLGIAEATVKSDKATVELARTQLGYAVITAPFDGVAGAPLAYPGAMITADTTDLVVINQTQPVNAVFSIPEASLAAIKSALAKREVEVEARVPGESERVLKGIVGFVDNAVDTSTGTIVLKARFDNSDGYLTPGQFVNLRLPTTRIADAVTVPVVALQNSANGPFLFVLKSDDTVEQRGVTPGAPVGKRLVIDKGLEQGERVVVEGNLLLVPGAKVTIASDAGASANPQESKGKDGAAN